MGWRKWSLSPEQKTVKVVYEMRPDMAVTASCNNETKGKQIHLLSIVFVWAWYDARKTFDKIYHYAIKLNAKTIYTFLYRCWWKIKNEL